MSKLISIDAVTGTSPYDVYICDELGLNCFYITETSTIPFTFEIPKPYDELTVYMLKLVDAQGCQIINTGE